MLQPIVFIMRGLPGSGKSTLVKNIQLFYHEQITVASADYFFTQNGRHRFVPELLPQAHANCFAVFRNTMTSGLPVIVDNTNSQRWEYQRYVDLAGHHRVKVMILEIPCCNETQLLNFHRRNIHNVPLTTMYGMYSRWETDPMAILISNEADLQRALNPLLST